MATQTTLAAPSTLLEEAEKVEQFDIDFARELRSNPDVPKEDRLKLGRYLKSAVNGNHKKVTYKLGKAMRTANLPLGRLCAVDGMGLQAFPRDLRAALAGRYYWDIDIANAMPTLLVQYCERNGWVCPALKRYVETREEVLEELMSQLGIQRWEAKERIVALYNGGSSEGLTRFIVQELAPEALLLRKNVWNANSEVLKWLKNHPNQTGKGMAWVYQTEERKVLLAMEAAFAKRGRSMDVYIHDGGLVRKKDGESELPARTLREVEEEVRETTGYSVRLVVKPMETTYERTGDSEGEYAEKKKAWEETGWKGAVWFKLRHPPCFVALSPDGTVEQMSKSDLLQNEEDNVLASGDPFLKRWLPDPTKREYQKLVFAPKQEPPTGCFNLFQGFANLPAEGDTSAYQTCLRIVSGNDDQVFAYIENWLAHILQRPSVKTKVAIVVQGEQGAGKDTFFDAVGDNIFGKQYYLSTNTPENDIFAKFNARAGHKILVKFEEANFQTNKENADKLKGLITSTHGRIEKKGHDPIELEDFTNIVMTTNNEIPVVIEDTDRRFMLVKASSERIGDTAFWDDIHAKLPKQAAAYHQYLLSKDLSDFVPWNQSTIPRTQFYKDVKQSFSPYHARFFQRQVELEMEMTYTAHNLFSRMKADCPAALQLNETRFGRDMRLYVTAGVFAKKKTSTHNTYEGDAATMRQFLEAKGWWVDY
jgi:hypothetical protein